MRPARCGVAPSETRLSNQGTQRTTGACDLNLHELAPRVKHTSLHFKPVLLWTLSAACSSVPAAAQLSVDMARHLLRFEVGKLGGGGAVGGRKWCCEAGRPQLACTPAGAVSRRNYRVPLCSPLRPFRSTARLLMPPPREGRDDLMSQCCAIAGGLGAQDFL